MINLEFEDIPVLGKTNFNIKEQDVIEEDGNVGVVLPHPNTMLTNLYVISTMECCVVGYGLVVV